MTVLCSNPQNDFLPKERASPELYLRKNMLQLRSGNNREPEKEIAMNIFDCAIKMEKEARIYYEELAAATAVPELKNLFTLLAAAEQEHHDALVEMKGSINPQKAQFNALQEAACLFQPLLAKRDLMAELKEDPDAYKKVVKQEEEDVRFYEELAAQAKDEETREILLKIADEERKHLSIVENIYSFVESPKTYLAWGEFSNREEF
jgi:rubrerythrin